MQGARQLAGASDGRLTAEYNAASLVELVETTPSCRIPFRGQYLDAFQTVSLTMEILPDGYALACINVRHRLAAHDHVTLDWVLRKHPEWRDGIKRVRHRYSTQGKPPLSAELVSVAIGRFPQSTISLPQGEVSLLDYHLVRGNIRDSEKSQAEGSSVVRLRYGKGKEPVEHLAALLQPMFDFDTLQRIDSPLLERLARHLKWPVGDRLKKASEMIKGMRVGELDVGLRRIEKPGDYTRQLKPSIHLCLAAGHVGDNERAVIHHGVN